MDKALGGKISYRVRNYSCTGLHVATYKQNKNQKQILLEHHLPAMNLE